MMWDGFTKQFEMEITEKNILALKDRKAHIF